MALLSEIHGNALCLLKGAVGVSVQILLRNVLQLGERMSLPHKDAGRNGCQLMKGQLPGVQQAADNLFCQLCEENHAEVRPVVIYIVDDAIHAGFLDGKLIAVILRPAEHFQKGVLRKGIALGGYAEMHRRRRGAGLAVQPLNSLFLLQERHGIA